jgi:hypothetical protein
VAQIAKRGECGIGEREHARVYPNGRSNAAARKQDERGGWWRVENAVSEARARPWGHLSWKSA